MLSLMLTRVNRYLCVPMDSRVEGLETCHVNTSISLDGVTVFLSQRISKFGCLQQKALQMIAQLCQNLQTLHIVVCLCKPAVH